MASSKVTPLPQRSTLLKFFQKQDVQSISMSETKIQANKETIADNKTKISSHNNIELSPSPQSNTSSEESPKITVGKPPLPPFSRQSKKESQILEGLFANASEGRSSGDTPCAKAPLSGSVSVSVSGGGSGSCQSPHEIMDDNEDSDACVTASTVAETVTVTPMPAKSAAKRARPSRAKSAVAAANNKKLKVSQAAAVKLSASASATATATPAAKAAEVEAVTVTSSEIEADTETEAVSVTEAEAVPSVPSVTAATVTAAARTLDSTDVEADSTADNTAATESSADSCPVDAAQSIPEAQGQGQEGEKSEITEECMAATPTITVDTDILTVETTTIGGDKKKGEPLTTELEKRKRKRPPTNVSAVATVNAKEEDKPLPADVVVKIQCHTDRMTATATELTALERLPDVCDCYLELEKTIDSLTAGHTPTQDPSPEPCNTDVPAAEWSEETAEALESKINAVIASCVQGSSEALHVLVPLVLNSINTAIAQLQIEPSADSSDTSTQPTTPSTDTDSDTPTAPAPASAAPVPCTDVWRAAALTALNKLSDPVVLGEKIKSLAKRTPYGIRAGAALVFENTDLLSLWRWEILSNVHFSTSSLTLRGTAKTVRARYGKLIKAEGKVVEQLGKSKGGAEGEAEISRLEEAASKAQEEVMKAKERRREMDKKRASDVEEKAKKEVLRLKKEENAALERKEKQAEKDKEKEEKKRQPTEKELKEAALLEKQRSVMLGFFNTPKPSSGAGGAAGGVGASSSSRSSSVFPTRVLTNRAGLGAAMGSTAALSHTLSHTLSTTHSLTATTSSSSSSSATVQYSIDLSDDQDPTGTHTDNGCAESAKRSFELAFEKDMTAKISMGEISRSLRERYSSNERHPLSVPKGKPRKPKHLSVTVSVAGNAFAQGPETYSELKDVKVDSRIKVLSFHEDYRPPYKGTFSKTSTVLTGRNPFEKDHNVFNYDFDSEGEWEEGDGEGEDIGESDEEEDGEADELVYDDFFRQDNDFGSDADSDGEQASAAAIQRRDGMENLGPRFLTAHHSQSQRAIKLDAEFEAVACSEREKDVVRLRAYCAVVHAAPALLPYLGGAPSSPSDASGAASLGDKKFKMKVSEFDAAMLSDLVKHIHGSKESMDKILASFQLAHPTASKNQIKKRILDIADKERHPAGHGSQRWIVKEEAKSKAGIVLPDAAYTPKRGKKAGPGSTPSSASSSSSSAASASATAVATAGSSSSRVLTVAAAIANMSSPSSRLRSATSSAASASKSLPIASPLLPRPPSASSTPSSLKKLAGKSSPKVSISKDGDVVDAVEAGDKFAVSSGIDGEAVATRDGTAGSATSPARKIPFTTPLPPVSSSSSSSSSTSSSSNSSSSSSRSSSSSGVPKKVTTSLLNFFNKPSDKASKKSEKKEKTEEEEVKDKEKEDKEKKEKEEREKKEKEEREKNYLVINLEDSCSGIGHTVTAAAGAAVGTGTGTGPVEGQ